MCGTSDTIKLMQVIRLDAVIDEPPAQLNQSCSVVVDSAEQDRLVQNGNAGINQHCESTEHTLRRVHWDDWHEPQTKRPVGSTQVALMIAGVTRCGITIGIRV